MKARKTQRAACVLALFGALMLSGCVPEQRADQRQYAYNHQQADTSRHAMAMLQHAKSSQREVENIITSEKALSDGLLSSQINQSQDQGLISGSCMDSTTDPKRRVVITWIPENNGSRPAFYINDKGASARLAKQLSTMSPSDIAGVMQDKRTIKLAAVRKGTDETEIILPDSCLLDIPNGAPVLIHEIVENTQRGEHDTAGYEYSLSDCPAGMIGARARQTYQKTDSNTGEKLGEKQTDETYEDGCI